MKHPSPKRLTIAKTATHLWSGIMFSPPKALFIALGVLCAVNPFQAVPQQAALQGNTPKPFRVEIEALRPWKVSAGDAQSQEMSNWQSEESFWSQDSQLFWRDQKIGDTLTLEFPASQAGTYNFKLFGTKAGDYGIVRLTFNENQSDPRDIDTYHPQVIPTLLGSGEVRLRAGVNTVKVEVVGQNPRSIGVFVGLDCLDFLPVAPVRAGEISLTGTAQSVRVNGSKMTLLAKKFTLPSGRSRAIAPNKAKIVNFNDQTLVHIEGETESVKLQELSLTGRSLTIIGPDLGSGNPLTAREIIVSR